ncbi:MAG TPA: RNA polymerase sigma factor [Thermoanaerobaculia bacterium]|jgi:RNA polymerase sigma-70 factor (ECF subfamily)|nr:RNA polymerase sigma factor [Thermoanaerobaculia bacterium]
MRDVAVAVLVERARDASRSLDEQHAAFAELVRRFEEAAFAWALQRVHDPEEARDLCQDAFLAAWAKLGQLREPAAFAGWLRRIVQRSPARRQSSAAAIDSIATASEQYGIALLGLPEKQRQAIVLHYSLGYTLDEIATMLGVPRGTIGKRLYSARINIRRRLPRRVRAEFQRPTREFIEAVRDGLFDEYTGTYRFIERPELTVTIRREGDRLVSESNGQRAVLASLRRESLVTDAFDGEGRFERNRRGQVTRFVYYEFGQRLGVAKKMRAG